jgi:tRNA (guanine-N7-)-methyltransferase
MEARGKRTTLDKRWTQAPRFHETLPENFLRSDINPYLVSHREFGPPLYPASVAQTMRDGWDEAFGRSAPLFAEIGSGNGFFLSGYAKARPEINLVGVEIRYKRTVLCARKIEKERVNNAAIVRYDAWFLDDLFHRGQLDGLFVLHPDPWPKTKTRKNRLISRWFLELAEALLKPGGTLRIKSDFAPNVSRVYELMTHSDDRTPAPRLGFDITGHSDDIVANGPIWDLDIETNYQAKYRRKSLPVSAIELTKHDVVPDPT